MKDPFRTLSPSILGFGSVPGTPEEARAYLQKRLRTFLALIGGLWLLLLVGQLTVMFATDMNPDRFVRLPLWVWAGTVVVLWGAWLLLRGARSLLVIDGVDAITT